jgi:hypothetical protein
MQPSLPVYSAAWLKVPKEKQHAVFINYHQNTDPGKVCPMVRDKKVNRAVLQKFLLYTFDVFLRRRHVAFPSKTFELPLGYLNAFY